ncbi:MAG TPA: hypothetical protein VFX61_09170 [Micromonosporaceae bacterium]|nr:hypothetical protein [Micromonosporaceae bacterium]
MAPTADDDELDRLLALADPAPNRVATDGDAALLVGELARSVLAQEQRPAPTVNRAGRRHRRRRSAIVAGLVAALTLGIGGVAFGYVSKARTGKFGLPGMTENDTSEWLRTDAVDFRQVVEELRPTDLPLPVNESFTPAVDLLIKNYGNERAVIQVTAVRSHYASYAACSWEAEWLAAHTEADRDRMDRAVEVLRSVPSWPAIVAVDGGGVRELHRDIAEAAARGDDAVVRRDLDINCPAHSTGMTR